VDSATIRSHVKTAATGIPHATLWPNGLGFDARGVQYVLVPRGADHVWVASQQLGARKGWAVRYGEGATPDAAKRAAGIGRAGRGRS
jgi:hypothetical protein